MFRVHMFQKSILGTFPLLYGFYTNLHPMSKRNLRHKVKYCCQNWVKQLAYLQRQEPSAHYLSPNLKTKMLF